MNNHSFMNHSLRGLSSFRSCHKFLIWEAVSKWKSKLLALYLHSILKFDIKPLCLSHCKAKCEILLGNYQRVSGVVNSVFTCCLIHFLACKKKNWVRFLRLLHQSKTLLSGDILCCFVVLKSKRKEFVLRYHSTCPAKHDQCPASLQRKALAVKCSDNTDSCFMKQSFWGWGKSSVTFFTTIKDDWFFPMNKLSDVSWLRARALLAVLLSDMLFF